MPPAGLEPALCRQKGILSPSCLPAFGKVDFRSLYRLISRCERDFSFHVNHVKLFHLVVLDLRSVRGPELPPRGVCSAQMRSSAASFAEISPDMILDYGAGNSAFFV